MTTLKIHDHVVSYMHPGEIGTIVKISGNMALIQTEAREAWVGTALLRKATTH